MTSKGLEAKVGEQYRESYFAAITKYTYPKPIDSTDAYGLKHVHAYGIEWTSNEQELHTKLAWHIEHCSKSSKFSVLRVYSSISMDSLDRLIKAHGKLQSGEDVDLDRILE